MQSIDISDSLYMPYKIRDSVQKIPGSFSVVVIEKTTVLPFSSKTASILRQMGNTRILNHVAGFSWKLEEDLIYHGT